jgi:hypothetical protein
MADVCVSAADSTTNQNGDATMTSQSHNETETSLRETFRTMDPHEYQEIRQAYYKAVEGLQALAAALEAADAEISQRNDHALIEEHLIACTAIDAMKQSRLGRVL